MIRVFPRKTVATPDDDRVRFSAPGFFDEAESVRVSVTFIEDKPRGEMLANAWRGVCDDVTLGGPAYNDPGDEFIPGLYVKPGYTITSRGCPNHCWFCKVPEREGPIRELPIQPGYNILDSNLLACSDEHIKAVFAMLASQSQRPKFTGGFEAKRLKPWIVDYLIALKPKSVFFAYDEPSDYEPLVYASRLLGEAGILPDPGRAYWCYVLIGYRGDTFTAAEKRLNDVLKLRFMPMAMLFDKEKHRVCRDGWISFQRTWANHIIVGCKMTESLLSDAERLRV